MILHIISIYDKKEKSEGMNGIKKKFLNWKILEENSAPNVNIKFFLNKKMF